MTLSRLVRVAVEAKAAELLDLLSGSAAAVGDGLRVERSGHGLVVLVSVVPADAAGRVSNQFGDDHTVEPGEFWHSTCSRDVLKILIELNQPLVLPQLQYQLEVRNQIHGESTLKKALAAMVKARYLRNPGHRAGYTVTNKGRLSLEPQATDLRQAEPAVPRALVGGSRSTVP